MKKLLALVAFAVVASAPAMAVMDLEAPTPEQILAEAQKKAYALPAASGQPAQAEAVAYKVSRLRRGYQTMAHVRSMTHRGSVPKWTHQCYATKQQARDAAIAACEAYNHTACYADDPWLTDVCDR